MPTPLLPIQRDLRQLQNKSRALLSQRFFKTAPGQYGHGDQFLGLTVPQIRQVVRVHADRLSLTQVAQVMRSPWHEERLAAVLVAMAQYQGGDEEKQKKIFQMYLKNIRWVNNWDLVDGSAAQIVGPQLCDRGVSQLRAMAMSSHLWTRRVAMIATYYNIKKEKAEPALTIARLLLSDEHDLMHKAVGWMLREVGKNCGSDVLVSFLKKHYYQIPRTALRYAIERFPLATRKKYLAGDF